MTSRRIRDHGQVSTGQGRPAESGLTFSQRKLGSDAVPDHGLCSSCAADKATAQCPDCELWFCTDCLYHQSLCSVCQEDLEYWSKQDRTESDKDDQ